MVDAGEQAAVEELAIGGTLSVVERMLGMLGI